MAHLASHHLGFRDRLSRRSLLRAAARAGVGATALAVAGCGEGTDPPELSEPPDLEALLREVQEPIRAQRPPLPSEGVSERGGTLRLHTDLDLLDFFDIHRSRFPTTQAFSALQQNRLIRYADINAGIMESDLAALPEIPEPDTYVFELREGIQWWDRNPTNGRPFTTADVRANFERQIAGVDATGEPDPLFQRQAAFAETVTLDVVDERTLVLQTDGPNAAFLGTVIAGPWAFFQAPEAWEGNGDRLRDDPLHASYYSGTGPFIVDRFVEGSAISFRRNAAYFREELPRLDAISYQSLTEPARQESAYREGELDLWSPADPLLLEPLVRDLPDQRLSDRPLPFAIQASFLFRSGVGDNPYRDRRLALAVHLALNRFAIVAATYGGFARLSGPQPWFAEGWAIPEETLLELPGYRPDKTEDIVEARRLVDAVGHREPLPLVVPDVFEATFAGIGAVIRQNLEVSLGVPIEIRTASYAQIITGLREGTTFAALGWGDAITDADPTADLLRTMHSEGADNLGGFSDPTLDVAIERMQATLDRDERQQIFRDEVQPRLNRSPAWIVNVANGIQRSISRAAIHLPASGFGWDAHLLEQAWVEGSDLDEGA